MLMPLLTDPTSHFHKTKWAQWHSYTQSSPQMFCTNMAHQEHLHFSIKPHSHPPQSQSWPLAGNMDKPTHFYWQKKLARFSEVISLRIFFLILRESNWSKVVYFTFSLLNQKSTVQWVTIQSSETFRICCKSPRSVPRELFLTTLNSECNEQLQVWCLTSKQGPVLVFKREKRFCFLLGQA